LFAHGEIGAETLIRPRRDELLATLIARMTCQAEAE